MQQPCRSASACTSRAHYSEQRSHASTDGSGMSAHTDVAITAARSHVSFTATVVVVGGVGGGGGGAASHGSLMPQPRYMAPSVVSASASRGSHTVLRQQPCLTT